MNNLLKLLSSSELAGEKPADETKMFYSEIVKLLLNSVLCGQKQQLQERGKLNFHFPLFQYSRESVSSKTLMRHAAV